MPINTDPHIHKLVMCANVFIRKDGTVFLKMRYDENGEVIEKENVVNVCAV